MTSNDILIKHTCEIVEDLLPLYVKDNLKQPGSSVADYMDTRVSAFVSEHLKNCPGCRSLLVMMQEDFPESCTDSQDIPAIPFRRKYHIRLALGMICAVTAALGVLALVL